MAIINLQSVFDAVVRWKKPYPGTPDFAFSGFRLCHQLWPGDGDIESWTLVL